ncbi:unnamed protein product [Vitrella brassicaformis CCMP3155]|uniref:Uncharacterized protein n=1 Tax=Vitrella brassicaformis (strain CCMP3155) TaxID=1169540 RepID=A0A0G4FPS6_VITBC|nr:unnamed protein product [Vitrella brassicaformis CCMP3155]|eukprot:CEM16439.1 unnamed protein product [Vitrella brassicaformis CCMP3155]
MHPQSDRSADPRRLTISEERQTVQLGRLMGCNEITCRAMNIVWNRDDPQGNVCLMAEEEMPGARYRYQLIVQIQPSPCH